ncbi:MAG: hypothetical protein ABR606_10500 [Vicinamibacterales bacterium]
MRPRGLAEAMVLVLAGLALTTLLTYPLVVKLDRLGRLNTDDGRWSIWVVSWVAHALTSQPLNLYDANIFYPHRNTLAFSEANIGAGAIGAPVWLITHNPYATHNVVVVVSFVISIMGAYYLVRALTGSRHGAAVAGVMYAFCPFVFARTAHIQLMLVGGLPFCMMAFHRLIDRPTVARSVTLGVLLWAQALSCAYYGIFGGLMVAFGTLWFAVSRRRWRSGEYWTATGLAALVCIGLTVPFFYPYIAVQQDQGFARTLDDARMYSADVGAWLASSAWAHRWWLPALGDFNEVLFPGVLVTAFGVAGFWLGSRSPAEPAHDRPPRDVVFFYAAIIGIAWWASFGPDAGLYTLLFETVPLFSFLRAPARMGIMVTLGLTVLAGIAVARLIASRPRQTAIAAALAVAVVAELMAAPLVGLREPAPLPRAYAMLATLPRGPVAEFPYFYRRPDFPRHAYYMLNSTAHWQPLVNGYSDHIPRDFREQVVPLSSFPSRESFLLLGKIGARYVVFHLDLYDRRSRERLLERLQSYGRYLRPLMQEEDVWLYEIVDWPN